uniref:Uncharacterized protein n=1 Tax=Vespula pensylvanica TaxID=30213 RepID=A0A834NSW5_VESPE|nr:hypothetical protein H0235_011660 [Vespula pensylvanica]
MRREIGDDSGGGGSGDGRWEMGDGRWEMGDGKWVMGNGSLESLQALAPDPLAPSRRSVPQLLAKHIVTGRGRLPFLCSPPT